MATLAPVTLISRKPRPASYYAAPAAIFLSAGVASAALRRRALDEPQNADVIRGTADAMDAMAVT